MDGDRIGGRGGVFVLERLEECYLPSGCQRFWIGLVCGDMLG